MLRPKDIVALMAQYDCPWDILAYLLLKIAKVPTVHKDSRFDPLARSQL
jgi:hypothetical protein